MIKVAEEEAQALAGTIRKKTYKGDVEIETDSQDRIEVHMASILFCSLVPMFIK